ncbi:MAG: TIGR02757 family protein [Treponema sp.]|jgi:uncharacterized protein (TIGR02757 family)|nr:TIGR02757 family protein [Treponema sp.]
MTLLLHRKRRITRDHKLDVWYKKFCSSESLISDFIAHDPVQFPHRFAALARKNLVDIEIAAFLAATIAWGRRDLIIRSAEKMFALMGPSPADFVMQGNYRKLKNNNIHRTFFEGDLKYFCKGFKSCYAKYGSLEKLFASDRDIWEGISLFREEMAAANGGSYSKHIANPGANSACKRINLALRWLVRKGPVDLGLWKSISPSALYIPLDVHVARTGRKLGLLQRKSNDKKAVIELTEKLREFCPQDPVKYDFALFSL